ncbi:MAG: hypothetical protein KBB94_05595 [Legionellaceae bacterium]|nr:hypothetical protein [Legionellaceae bacterium]MBP9775854.1 hypothetical protein [Legionellaceae bacterium]
MINHYTLSISLLTAAEFKKAFTEIPPSVTSLWVFDHWLFERTGAELSEAFSGIPPSVTSLDLRSNGIFRKTVAELIEAFSGIPTWVREINIDGTSCHPAEYILERIFPSNIREAYYSNPISPEEITPTFEIDEQTLMKIIKFFEASDIPMGFLVCALLLDGTISNVVEEEKGDNQRYQDSRMLGAIAFYRKAACDATLKPIIEAMLWYIRTTNENVVVQEELKKYHFTPSEFAPCFDKFSDGIALAKDDNDLLDIADHSSTPVPDISDIYDILSQGEVDVPFISLNPCLVLGLLSSAAVGLVGIALLWLSTPALVAIVGTGMISVATVASCCFFYNARQGNDRGNQRESWYACCGIG